LIDRAGRIIAGNKTVARARALGLPLRVIQTDGRQLVAVQRRDLDLTTDARARNLALADNRVGELDLAWDLDVLLKMQKAGVSLSPWFTEEEFAALLRDHSSDGHADENAVIAPGPTTIQRGDLFQLGRHRLLCGDATVPADVARVLNGTTP